MAIYPVILYDRGQAFSGHVYCYPLALIPKAFDRKQIVQAHVLVEVLNPYMLFTDLAIWITKTISDSSIRMSSQMTWHIVGPDHFGALAALSVLPGVRCTFGDISIIF
jgi:hypothetical protein